MDRQESRAGALTAQIIGPLVSVVFISCACRVLFRPLDALVGMRVSPDDERQGLDVPEMGARGNPEVQRPGPLVRGLAAGAPPQPAPGGLAPERSR